MKKQSLVEDKDLNEKKEIKPVKVVTTYMQYETLEEACNDVALADNFIRAEINLTGDGKYNIQVLSKLE